MDSKNINANIAQRLFAYIQYHDDINTNIKNIYKNSLIFIGDEQQIYVPAMETYVGIGMTAYNTTLDTISEIQSAVAQLQKKASGASVNYITTGFTFGSEVTTNDDNGELFYSSYIRTQQYHDLFNPQDIGDSDPNNFMSGKVFIFGEDNYNPNTHFAYHPGSRFILKNGELDPVRVSGTDALDEDWKENANSGISLSYGTKWTYVHVDGNDIYAPQYSYLRINDSKTWSYMTSAYSYTLDFTRQYTATEIENLYHNILGIGENILVPVTKQSMWKINPATGNSEFVAGEYWYWNDSSTAIMPLSIEYNDQLSSYEFTMPEGTTNHWTQLSGTPNPNSNTQYYKINKNYNNTYNTNISDGIQTIKEVAYILDQITDGGIGTTTYITKDQWDEITNSSSATTYAVSDYEYDTNKTYTGTIYRVISGNGNPTTNTKKYAYWINTIDPENLGIQIAQSIAGNAADITDLHNHVELIESGETSIRSISVQNSKGASSDLITVYGWNNGTIFTPNSTDTQESLTTVTDGLTGYSVGDYRMMTKLDLATTYITLNSNDNTVRNINGVEYSGLWQSLDVIEKKEDGSLGIIDIAGKTIAEWKNNTYEPITTINQFGVESLDYALSTNRVFIYKPNGTNSYNYINNTFKEITWTQYNEYSPKPNIYKYLDKGSGVNAYREFYLVDTAINESTFPAFIMNEPEETPYKVHAITTEENKIATTAWTIALVDDKQASLQDKIDGILEEAKEYTNKKIRLLDADYKTEDYVSIAESIIDSTYVPGTEAYEEEIMRLRSTYANAERLPDSLDFTYNVLINRIRSEYTYNIFEVDGIVSAESRELPTDLVSTKTTIWNAENITFEPIDLERDGSLDDNTDPDTAADKLERLFSLVYNENTFQANPIYFKPADEGDKNHTTYLPVASNATIGNTPGQYYWYNSETGEFTTFENDLSDKWAAVYNSRRNSPYWTQPYTKEDQYYEIDIDSINNEKILQAFDEHESISGDITKELVFFTYNNGTEYYNSSRTPTLYIKRSDDNKSTDYLLAKSEHYNYATFGGNGQNKISIEAHITRIEDAAKDNTGFADAYDVQTYIENMFTWVNISASINDAQLSGSERFYKKYTEFSSTATNLWIYDGREFVQYDANKKLWFGTSTTNGTTVAAEVGGAVVNASAQNPGSNAENVITATLHKWWANSNNEKQVDIYYRIQNAFINPINMTLTKVAPARI